MSLIERAGLAVMHSLDPEAAHNLALKALNGGLVPMPGQVTSPRLATTVAGLSLPNPVGLAAGFDKNGVALAPLSRVGFGFVEVGATTPRPQPGNPRPRLFRLSQDRAAINRFGFNNEGMTAMADRLRLRPRGAVVGLNLGANKDSADRAADYAEVMCTCGGLVDFATVNVSSPNTERLRDLQGPDALRALLMGVLDARSEVAGPPPVFLKIAPDLTDADLSDVARVAAEVGVDGIIATNTTLSREGLHGPHRAEKGGLSGAPLTQRATEVMGRLYTETGGTLPLIGVGGIGSATEAYTRIRAGASAVQLYTALVYEGISLGARIAKGLDTLLLRDGFDSVAAAVGADHR